ncbi:porin [Prevotella communis]|uniref:porin n=1 Tax=Prevotella communis TaxID=2913614 RepID=UPI001EDAAF15|nr:porin [Prevotella communis]UKK57433.1 OprO/OprP family phosphate-selective porin [Prevotella communis]UKK62849.1 OprO/OprP family phosphate-selective porin [Prevotella communis]UKK65675.1 OprO/OprP family phosphate-selective porin [Prevotella communis]UKK68095.1 OprO/OprP family phosphate-selective porin [Prevotella communis]UKK69768.1 OprO/OprP family phosphate-selective porin [Prevotella communis]
MKKVLLAALMMGATLGAQAQSEWFKNVKFSGYGMVQYQASDQDAKENNGFNLRLVRMALEGRAHEDFYWKVQMQINGNTYDPDKSSTDIRLVDLFGEWQKYEFFKVKAGQFKRPFTFENPMHPITQGFMSYSQNVSKLAGFSDRCGGNASNGRDIGVQIQGDFLKNAEGRNLLHYQVGAFNGEGINQKDKDNRKDIIGGMWVMPVKGMRIGAFGWTGSRAGVGEKNRYALSGEYAQNDWTFRTEYIHSQGWNAAHTSDKADGIYALCIAPIQKNKMHVKARYDLYREAKEWGQSKTMYEVGADYMFTKNLQINLEYARVNDRTIANADKHNYNMVDVELDFRF